MLGNFWFFVKCCGVGFPRGQSLEAADLFFSFLPVRLFIRATWFSRSIILLILQ